MRLGLLHIMQFLDAEVQKAVKVTRSQRQEWIDTRFHTVKRYTSY